MTVTLHLGDCLEVMKTIPAGSVDAVITDPPYGIALETNYFDKKMSNVRAYPKQSNLQTMAICQQSD